MRGDYALVRLLVAPDFRFSIASQAADQNLDEYLALLEQWRGAFGELELILRDLLQEGATVAAHYELAGRHVEPVYGVAPSGRRGSLQIMSFLDFAGERVVAHRAVIDFVSSIAMGALTSLTRDDEDAAVDVSANRNEANGEI